MAHPVFGRSGSWLVTYLRPIVRPHSDSGSGRIIPIVHYRLTDLSLWGLQWERKDDDRELARRLFVLLEDRRMLWKDFSVEIEERCVRSAEQARRDLTSLLSNLRSGRSSPGRLAPYVPPSASSWMRSARSMTTATTGRPFGDRADALSQALGRLRGLVGLQIGEIAAVWASRCQMSSPLSCRISLGGSLRGPFR